MDKKGLDMKIQIFESSGLSLIDGNVFANRKQLKELYNVPRKTLEASISKLKNDGLIIGRNLAISSKDESRENNTEVYNLDEIISIGFRLRSEVAIKFQKWAREIIKSQLVKAYEELRIQQAQLDYFWDREDVKDLYQ